MRRVPVAVGGDSLIWLTTEGILVHTEITNQALSRVNTQVGTGFTDVSAGGINLDFYTGVSGSGLVYVFQDNTETLDHRRMVELAAYRIVSASVGYNHFIAVDDTGVVYCWGNNEHGQCGLVVTVGYADVLPQRVSFALRARSISAGRAYSLVVTEDGKLHAFGKYPVFQSPVHEIVPFSHQIVPFPGRVKIVSAAAGYEHALALTSHGEVFAWGKNEYGQLGIDTDDVDQFPVGPTGIDAADELQIPTNVFGDPDSIFVSAFRTFNVVTASGYTSGAACTDGSVHVWGILMTTSVTKPFRIPVKGSVTAISLNRYMIVCVTEDSRLRTIKFDTIADGVVNVISRRRDYPRLS